MAHKLSEQAKADLGVRSASGLLDRVVWDHSLRVAQLAEVISALPELADRAIDRTALTAAALYHDAGWVLQCRAGQVRMEELLVRPTNSAQRDLGADWVVSRLGGILPTESLERASAAIRFCHDRQTSILESQILTEADNLDEIGPQAIAILIRKQMAEGRTLADLVATWQRQEEYHYWQTRIKESFRFAPIRAVAERRWKALQQFMHHLRASLQLDDFTRLAEPEMTPVDVAMPSVDPRLPGC